jgi:aryl-alcohol dehydrogenase-like predicted oxidoreductase
MNVQTAPISRLGLGCARIGSFNNPQPLSESRALIAHALDRGISVIDTSNIYGQGDSETQIGLAVRGLRDKAFIVTKTGRGFSNKMRILRPLKPLLRPLLAARKAKGADAKPVSSTVTARREQELRFDWSPASFAPSLEASLRRLHTDRVDGFLLHSPTASDLNNPAIGEALAALKRAGKLVHFGVSCDDRAGLDAALAMPGLSLLQLPWDVIGELDSGVQDFMKSNGIIVLAREVIRQQPNVSPAQAVQIAARAPTVDCALVGTTSRVHLDALADAVESA